MNERIKEKLIGIPKKPGSYQFIDNKGDIIYVGKAKNLFNRVHSYFTGSHDTKTQKLVMQIEDIQYIITTSETEALILELNLIKKHNPKYNILLTDDKKYPYIVITDETHPRVLYTRDIKKRKGTIYGPFPNSYAAKNVVRLINRMFPFRKCRRIPKKECLYYHIDQCLAPCINQVDTKQYIVFKKKIRDILHGNVHEEVKQIKKLMDLATSELNFEKAIEYRKTLEDLHSISERQNMEGNLKDADVISYVTQDDDISIQVFHIRENKMIEREGYLFKYEDEKQIFSDFIYNFYIVNNNPIPKEVILPYEAIDNQIIKTKIIVPKKGNKKKLIELVQENAYQKIDALKIRKKYQYDRTIGATNLLSKLLKIKTNKIEAFDNSNIMGNNPVSAMVCFIDGVPYKKGYRLYKIKTVVGANEAKTMEEVIIRRYKDNNNLPDLIVADGGPIQVNACEKALTLIKKDIPVLGLIKDDNHKTNELLFKGKRIKIEKSKQVFKLLERIQEEVHRFAITFFRKTYSKNTLSSKLDGIKGIGNKKKMQILKLLQYDNFEEQLEKLALSDVQRKQVLSELKNIKKED